MQLERLAQALDEGDVPTDCDGLAEAFRLFDRFAALLAQAVGAFDARGEWAADFAVSCTSWLRHRAGLTRAAAATTVRTARTLRELPVTAGAWRDGAFTGGQVQAVTANVDDRTLPQLVAQEADLVPVLVPLTTAQTARAMRFWRVRAEALAGEGAEPRAPERDVRLSQTYGGRWVLGGEVLGGSFVDGATVRRLLCDASVHRVVTEGRSTVLDYGTSTRTVPAHLRAALALRDRGCRHDGCDRPPEWCEAHHVVPVLEGGPTSLDNLVLKCTRHHHLGHQPGWHEKLLPDGTLVTTDPKGRTRTTRPPGVVQQLVA